MEKVSFKNIGLVAVVLIFFSFLFYGILEISPDFLETHSMPMIGAVSLFTLIGLYIVGSRIVDVLSVNNFNPSLSDLLHNMAVNHFHYLTCESILEEIMSLKFRKELKKLLMRGEVDIIFRKRGSISQDHLREMKNLVKDDLFEQVESTLIWVLEENDAVSRREAFLSLMKNEVAQTLCVLAHYPRVSVSQDDLKSISSILAKHLGSLHFSEQEVFIKTSRRIINSPETFVYYNEDGIQLYPLKWYEMNRFTPNPKLVGSRKVVFETKCFKSDYLTVLALTEKLLSGNEEPTIVGG